MYKSANKSINLKNFNILLYFLFYSNAACLNLYKLFYTNNIKSFLTFILSGSFIYIFFFKSNLINILLTSACSAFMFFNAIIASII